MSPMNTFADIVLAPIAMFSGKPLAVGIALFLLLTALGLCTCFGFTQWLEGSLEPTKG